MDESALLQAILEDPEDLETRRVYADVLTSQGEPRGELIQIQCELETLAPGDPRRPVLRRRADDLLAEHRARWTAPFAKQISSCEFRRGMVEVVRAKPSRLFNEDDQLFVREPVLELAVTRLAPPGVVPFSELPLEGVRTLRVNQSGLADTIGPLFASPTLASLRALDLGRAGLVDGAIVALRSSRLAGQLETLVLDHNLLSFEAIGTLVADVRFEHLAALSIARQLLGLGNVRSRRGDVDVVAELAARLALPRLASLDLADNQLSNAELSMLISNRRFRALRELGVAGNRLNGPSLGALAALPELEVLRAENNPIGPDAGAAIAGVDWPHLRALQLGHMQRLSQGRSRLGDDGTIALARARLPTLAVLDLRGHEITGRGVRALAGAGFALDELDLSDNKIGLDGARALVKSPLPARLRVLKLSRTGLASTGIAALVGTPWPRLEVLELAGERLDHEGFSALLAAHLPRLIELDLSGTRPSRHVQRAFARRLGSGFRG